MENKIKASEVSETESLSSGTPNHQSALSDGVDGKYEAGPILCPGNHDSDEMPCDECLSNQIIQSI